MRILRPIAVIALTAAALVGTTGAASASAAPVIERGSRAIAADPTRAIKPTTAPTPTVTVLGDSITWGACDTFAQSIPGWVNVNNAGCMGWPGATSDEMQAFVENQSFRSAWPGAFQPYDTFNVKQAIARSDALVIGLGTNDALRDQAPFNPSTWPAGDVAPVPSGHVPVDNGYLDQKIDYFMKLAGGKPVYWYDLGVWTKDTNKIYYFNHRNERLYAAMKRWPNLHMMAWGGVVGASSGKILTDEVHPGPAGITARWQLLKNAMGR